MVECDRGHKNVLNYSEAAYGIANLNTIFCPLLQSLKVRGILEGTSVSEGAEDYNGKTKPK